MIPRDLAAATCLNEKQLRRSEDSYVDELFCGVVELGAPLLTATISRAYVDLNRDPTEFDQKLFAEPLPESLRSNSVRAHSGLGVVPRIVSEGEVIYKDKLTLESAVKRVEQAYRPYHTALLELIETSHRHMGKSIVLDCHSMPNSAAQGNKRLSGKTADVILGDRFGTSCSDDIVSACHETLTAQGLQVVRNHPYPGGHITYRYGEPHRNRHALQIEVNRSLYMNETNLQKRTSFARLQSILTECLRKLFEEYRSVGVLRAAE